MTSIPVPLSRRSGLAAMALCGLVTVTACGGGTSTSSTPTTTPASTTAVPATPNDSTSPPGGSASPVDPAQTDAPVPVESNPPGDIPDNLAFVPYANTPGRYSFTHPEGWAQTGNGTAVQFTDKLNGVNADSATAGAAATVASARDTVVPQLQASVPAFEFIGVTQATVPAGSGVKIVFRRNSAPDPVTGKVYRDEVEEYRIFNAGREVILDLYGPVGADNVDAYVAMSQSLSIS